MAAPFCFAHICQALIEAGINASDFASFFLPRLAPLAHDPVVNVRIAASRTIGTIYTNEPFCRELSEIAAPSRTAHEESGHALDQMTYRFALDKDSDVRSFVMAFVNNDILEKQREKDSKAAEEAAAAAAAAEIAIKEETAIEEETVIKEEMMETTPMQEVEESKKDGEDEIMSDVEDEPK
ncbi:hypothetical protein G6F17_013290 [Rhizopus arrhizus]|nr:hypothetical protein G6F17_013290 [Rhizopus arrhizus]